LVRVALEYGAAIGPFAAALVFEATKSYGTASVFMVALLIASLVAIYFVKLPKAQERLEHRAQNLKQIFAARMLYF
jgi:MFS-type transporter involved in bile tolerance (Atg22 family)